MVTATMKLKDAYSLEVKAMTNLDSILESRDITWPTKVCIVIAMVFPVVKYECESWSIKKNERWTIDGFGLCAEKDSWESLGDQINPKGDQPWIVIGKTDSETSIL